MFFGGRTTASWPQPSSSLISGTVTNWPVHFMEPILPLSEIAPTVLPPTGDPSLFRRVNRMAQMPMGVLQPEPAMGAPYLGRDRCRGGAGRGGTDGFSERSAGGAGRRGASGGVPPHPQPTSTDLLGVGLGLDGLVDVVGFGVV